MYTHAYIAYSHTHTYTHTHTHTKHTHIHAHTALTTHRTASEAGLGKKCFANGGRGSLQQGELGRLAGSTAPSPPPWLPPGGEIWGTARRGLSAWLVRPSPLDSGRGEAPPQSSRGGPQRGHRKPQGLQGEGQEMAQARERRPLREMGKAVVSDRRVAVSLLPSQGLGVSLPTGLWGGEHY